MEAVHLTGWDVVVLVLSIFGFSAVFLFMAYFAWKATERMESQPKYHRAFLLGMGGIYLVAGLNGIYSVATGQLPGWELVFLLIPAFSAWTYLRSASRIEVPQK